MAEKSLYVRPDRFTDPGGFADLYDALPDSPAELRAIVANLMRHADWLTQYGLPIHTPASRATKPAARRLDESRHLFAAPLDVHRTPEQRTFGTCRDYSLMLCSMLRHKSIPARVRCGFATYFKHGPRFEDHWVCEYWSADHNRWTYADAQIDAFFSKELGITFDCADLPDGAFVASHDAWRMMRGGQARPDDFGHGQATGSWFVRVNVYRDLLALTNQLTSRWDSWREAPEASKHLTAPDFRQVDMVVEQIVDSDMDAGVLARLASQAQNPFWRISAPITPAER